MPIRHRCGTRRMAFLLVAGLCLLSGCSKSGQPGGGPSSTSVPSVGGQGKTQAPQMMRPQEARSGLFVYRMPLEALRPIQDSIVVDVSGTVGQGMLGHVHDLRSDEDLHFSLDAPALQTPLVCELMNARSQPPDADTDKEYWPQTLSPLFSKGAVTVRGVFRIWPDHSSTTQEQAAEATPTTNPPHVAEIHPISGIGQGRQWIDTRANLAPITFEGREYAYKDPGRWGDMMSHTISAQTVSYQGRDYLEIQTPQIGFNYWRLKLQIVDPVANVPGGHRFTARVVTPTRVYTEPVRCFTVAGTQADREAATQQPGQETPVVAIGRYDLAKLLQAGGYQGPPPVELCVFGINPPNLPEAGNGEEAGRSSFRRRRGIESFSTSPPAQAPETAAPTLPAGSEANAPYIGNRRSHVYHSAEAPDLPAPRNRVYFSSRQEAEAAGYRPAGDVH